MRKLLIIAAAALTLAGCTVTPADAAEVNFQSVLTDADGQPIKDGDGKVMTLGRAVMFAMMSTYPEDATIPAEEKVRRGNIALRAYTATKPVDMTAEDIVLAKKYVGKLSTLVVVRAFPLLDPATR